MLWRLRAHWRPLRRRLKQGLGLGRYGRRALEARLLSSEHDMALLLRRLHPGIAAHDDAGAEFHDHEIRLSSQNGEDGLLLHILSAVGVGDRRIVELGIEDGRECLARMLILHFGWSGLLLDCEAANVADARRFFHVNSAVAPDRLRIVECFVTAENIDGVLADNGITGEIDLLAIDIDGNDYWVWKAIEAVRPRVVVIEYNASLGPDEALITVYDPQFDRKTKHSSGWYHGASLAALADLGRRRGYALVGSDSSGINAFFVRRELLGDALTEVTPRQAWRPHRTRTERATPGQQLALLKTLPLVKDS